MPLGVHQVIRVPALGKLVSSKVNQWTLLQASLPIAYAIGGGWGGLPFDDRQVEEVFITSAQSLFAVVLIGSYCFSWAAAAALFVLFAVQFAILSMEIRMAVGWIYVGLAVVMAAMRRVTLIANWRTALGPRVVRARPKSAALRPPPR